MKRKVCLSLVICFASFAGLVSCKGTTPDDIKDTPVRVGSNGASGLLDRAYSFSEAFEEATLVVDVTIASWLREETGEVSQTYFRATVNKVLKGECAESIELIQSGASDVTYKNFPLFKRNDRLFLFLEPSRLKETGYIIVGSYGTVMDIQASGGKEYLLDRCGTVTEFFASSTEREYGMSVVRIDADTRSKLDRQMRDFDPLLFQNGSEVHRNVVLYSDTVDYAQHLNRGVQK